MIAQGNNNTALGFVKHSDEARCATPEYGTLAEYFKLKQFKKNTAAVQMSL